MLLLRIKFWTTIILSTGIVTGLKNTSYGQIQKGLDIHGEAAEDCSGVSVCMPDANTVAIGAQLNDGSALNAGHVRIYSWNGNAWLQKGNDIDGEATEDRSGIVCMPDANTIAIGARLNNNANGIQAGHVRIYSWNGTGWVQKGIDIDGEAALNNFGYAVSMPDSNTIAIGGSNNSGFASEAGHVRIYFWNGNSWIQKGVDIDGEGPQDLSGFSVSMPDSNTVAIGAVANTGIVSVDTGYVRIFTWNGTNWTQKGMTIYGEHGGDWSGWSVSMPDSNVVAIGARHNNGAGIQSGHVRIFTWNGVSWIQKGIDIDGLYNSNSGNSVSMPDANNIVIGALANSGSAFQGGQARIYSWNGSSWVQRGIDIYGVAAYDQLGISVSMPDLNTIAVGANLHDGNGLNSGHVRIYELCMTLNSVNVTSCNTYLSPSGNYIWTTSGIYTDTIPNASGCDSIITINLVINSVDVSITNSSPTLIANATGASYQWLDCNNFMASITGENNQAFIATINGNYAVEITQNGCTDTSFCEIVNNVGVLQNDSEKYITIYPNPADRNFFVDLNQTSSNVVVIIRNIEGQEVNIIDFENSDKLQIPMPVNQGVYFIEIKVENKSTFFKIVKL